MDQPATPNLTTLPSTDSPAQPPISPVAATSSFINPPLPEKKKGSLRTRLKIIFGTALFLFIGLFLTLKFLSSRTQVPDKVKVIEEPRQSTESVVAEDPIKTFKSDVHKFTFKYPREATLEDFSPIQSDPKSMRVYMAPNQPDFTEETLTQGYVFKVLIYKTLTGTLEELTKRKSESYKQSCTSTPVVSEVTKTPFNNFAALTFSVTGCPMDFKEMFLQRNSTYVEVIQVYAGDIGYKQKYKSITDEILGTLTFFEDIDPLLLTNERFTSDKNGFSFLHPKLDSTCCNIPGPVKGKTEKLVVLAKVSKSGIINGKKFDGMAVYVEENYAKQTFDDYVADQKAALIADYRLVTGKEPITSEMKIKVGDRDGLTLTGYAWWADVTYVSLPIKQNYGAAANKFLVIFKTEEKPGSFKDTYEKVLASFKFN